MNDYKQLELYVGYDELEDDDLDYCMLILTGNTRKQGKDKEKIKIFNHHSTDVDKYNFKYKIGKWKNVMFECR